MVSNPAHLFPLYGILFCAPGIPSVYYGSEYGIHGKRDQQSDHALRPAWNDSWQNGKISGDLFRAVADFARIRRSSRALQQGGYQELFVSHEQFAFLRESGDERIIVAVNAAMTGQNIGIPRQELQLPPGAGAWKDLLSGETLYSEDSVFHIPLYPSWLRILRYTGNHTQG